jgi:hypothetical protein
MESVIGHGGRQIFMGFVDGDLLRGELSEPPADLADSARGLIAQVEGAETIRIRGKAGTDLTLKVAGRPWLTDAAELEPGQTANYPGGEIFVAPHSDGADGVLVADLTVPYTVEGLVDEPVTLRFERGRALLRKLSDKGVGLKASGVYSSYIVDEIQSPRAERAAFSRVAPRRRDRHSVGRRRVTPATRP